MDLDEAARRAERLMDKHGLKGWSFGFDRSLCKAGRTHYEKRLITLSQAITELNEWSAMEDVVLHEIAHVLVGKRVRAHGREWKAMAITIGATPSRCVDVRTPPRKWQATCRCEGWVHRHHQRPADRSKYCRTCNQDLVWKARPTTQPRTGVNHE